MHITLTQAEYASLTHAVKLLGCMQDGEFKDSDWREVDGMKETVKIIDERVRRLPPEETELERLRRENDALRRIAACKMPCHYCGVDNIAKCPSGFPGCALADDELIGEETWAYIISNQRDIITEMQDVLRRLLCGNLPHESADPIGVVVNARERFLKGPITPPSSRPQLTKELHAQLKMWASSKDMPLPEDAEIDRLHPTEEGDHRIFHEALRFVERRHSKYGLVNLVSWLLHRLYAAGVQLNHFKEVHRAMDDFRKRNMVTTPERFQQWIVELGIAAERIEHALAKATNPAGNNPEAV